MTNTIYDQGLDACAANFAQLTPLDFLARTATIHPDRLALVHGPVRRTWAETRIAVAGWQARCRRAGSGGATRWR